MSSFQKKYKCSKRTIQRKLDLYDVIIHKKTPSKVVVLMDTNYWSRNFGVMLFKDAYTKDNLLKYYVKTVTNSLYVQGINELKTRGFEGVAIVCDGRPGLLQSYEGIPVQVCQFHQVIIIRRYIAKSPKTPANIDLKEFVAMIKKTDKDGCSYGISNGSHS
jgi:hypothetical protein